MTYTMKQSDWQWLIETDSQNKHSLLKYKRPTDWIECGSFDSPEAAADAVSQGKTGAKDWDDLKHPSPIQGLASWLIDPGASITPLISDLIKGVILPPELGEAQ